MTDSNGSSAGNSSVRRFFERPIIDNPYEYPRRHWELDAERQPTHRILDGRRPAEFITPFPTAQQHGAGSAQARLQIDRHEELSTDDEQYLTAQINTVRRHVDRWRDIPNPNDWGVTPTTARLLRHWRSHKFSGIRPFFCQVEAAETAIWLTEVAPRSRAKAIVSLLRSLEQVSHAANPGLSRLALKMATGAGKATVMAMLIAWQTVNAVRHPNSPRFTRGFLVVTPGITIRDRLRVLQPNDPDAYYGKRELIPSEMIRDLNQARIVITELPRVQAARAREAPAEEGTGKGGRARSAGATGSPADRHRGAVRALREDIPALGGGRDSGPTVLHHRLQQHIVLEAGVRVRFGLPAAVRERDSGSSEWTVGPFSQFRRPRQPARPTPHPADRQSPDRVRRRFGSELSQDCRRRDRALSPGAGRAHRKPQ